MNRSMNSMLKRITARGLLLAACIVSLMMQPFTASPAFAAAATTLPVLWTAGGLSAGNDSAGQAARMTTDVSGNVAIVSGPSGGRDLAVTSYTADGIRRWRSTITPASGTFVGDWVVAAPNGDFVAVGHNITSSGNPIAISMVRYASDGTLLWRVDLARTLPSVVRLLVDTAGNAYLAFNSVGDGQDIQLHKYGPSGVLLWSQAISSGPVANDIATSLALSPDETDVVVTGDIAGGATWITAAYNTTTGARRWMVTAAEGTAARDVIVDANRVYVTGQGVTGAGTPALAYFLTVVAYDRTTGARLWRTDKKPSDSTSAAGLRMAKAPDGSLVVTGQASRGFLDWYTVSFETTGAVRWEAVRDGGLNTDEIPASVLVRADGTTVVTGRGGPNLPGGYIPGVTAGYSSNGTLLWEAFSRLETVWATALPNGDVCATGGYDALITCWRTPGTTNYQPVLTATPVSGTAPLTVNFTRSVTSDPNGPIISYVTLDYGNGPGTFNPIDFGDGTSTFTLNQNSSTTYLLPGTYTAALTVFYNNNTSVTTTVIITVNPSVTPGQPPLITASPMSGTAPLTVTLTSSATMDPNGPLISSYEVNYGDGTSNQYILNAGNGVPSFTGNSSHTYSTAGTYTATLTVFYANGVSASNSVTITVSPAVTPVLRSSAINLTATRSGSRVTASGQVVVRDAANAAISGVSVNITWRKPDGTTVTQTATTGSSGNASFNTSGGRGTYTLTVNNLTKTGYTFDSAHSVLSKSITK